MALAAYTAVMCCLAIARMHSLSASTNDLGSFDQIFWVMLHKGYPLCTLFPPYKPSSWFGRHFSPLLYALLPVYAVAPYPETLVVLNVSLIALAAVPIYLVARHWRMTHGMALGWCAAYLCNPFVLSGCVWDFHEIAMVPLLMGFGLYAVTLRNPGLLVAMSILLLMCKEQYGLTLIGFGMLWAVLHKDRRTGLALAAAGGIAFLAVFGVLMPWLNGQAALTMLSDNSHRQFAWLFHSAMPLGWLVFCASAMWMRYVLLLTAFFLFVPFYAAVWLLPAMGEITVNALADTPMTTDTLSYHSVAIIPVLVIAAMRAVLQLAQRRPLMSLSKMTMCIVSVNVICGYLYAPAPFPGSKNIWETHLGIIAANPYRDDIESIRSLFAPDKALSVQSDIGVFFTHRFSVYMFPAMLQKADGVVLHLDFPFQKRGDVFGSYFGTGFADYTATVQRLLRDPAWGVVYWHDRWLVLERNKPNIIRNKSQIQEALSDLRKKYPDK